MWATVEAQPPGLAEVAVELNADEIKRLGVRISPPRLGEHTDVLLAGLGYPREDIAALRERHVVA